MARKHLQAAYVTRLCVLGQENDLGVKVFVMYAWQPTIHPQNPPQKDTADT